jgi:hypothetical protein
VDRFGDQRSASPQEPAAAQAPEGANHGQLVRQRALHLRAVQRKKAREAAAPKARIPESGGSPLAADLQERMGGKLGADLSSVKVHTGAGSERAAESYGARAFTVGSDIHFGRGEYSPGTREGDRLLAHELTHVVQGQRSGVQRKEKEKEKEKDKDKEKGEKQTGSGEEKDEQKADGGDEGKEMSEPGDPAEQEAEEAADKVADGDEADSIDKQAPELGREPNPQALKDDKGKDTTKDADPKGSDGYGNDADNSKTPGQCEPMDVNIVHDDNNPIQIDGVPNQDDLYQEAEAGAGQHVDNKLGSVNSPYVKHAIDKDNIFIGGSPTEQDVQQGQIGDCYFLAGLLQVLQKDPGKIPQMMKVSGDTVSATFWRFDKASNKYVEQTISTDKKLAHDIDPKTGEIQNLHGSGFRVDDKALRSDWYATIKSNTLGVVKREYYQAALWAPLLEKAYAAFSEAYGQYGGNPAAAAESITPNPQKDKDGKQNSGYQMIDGGFEHLVYSMFYGDAVKDQGQDQTNFDPSKNVVLQNMDAMKKLMQSNGQAGSGLGDKQQMMLTASASYDTMFGRVKPLADIVMNLPAAKNWPKQFKTDLKYLEDVIQAWSAVQNDEKKEKKAKDKVARTARQIAAPKSWPMLHRESTPKEARNLLEVLDDVANAGTDNDPGQRMVYSEHAYSITGVHFRNQEGAEMQLDEASLAEKAKDVDALKSQVTMRNPHRTNEPDVDGQGKPDDGSADDGNFTIDLDQFFRNFSKMDFAVVQK